VYFISYYYVFYSCYFHVAPGETEVTPGMKGCDCTRVWSTICIITQIMQCHSDPQKIVEVSEQCLLTSEKPADIWLANCSGLRRQAAVARSLEFARGFRPRSSVSLVLNCCGYNNYQQYSRSPNTHSYFTLTNVYILRVRTMLSDHSLSKYRIFIWKSLKVSYIYAKLISFMASQYALKQWHSTCI
jgi:hypothetical protein